MYLSSSGDISITFDWACSDFETTVSGITYDQFGRATSYNFDMRCTTSSERYAGRVYNIQYNEIGQALSAEITINGQHCSI